MSNPFSFRPRSPLSAALGFAILDVFFVYLHKVNGWTYSMFNLDIEHNLPTLYQGSKYLVIAWFCWFLAYYYRLLTKHGRQVRFWALLALFVTWLGLDELGMLHEFLLDAYLVELFPAWDGFQRAEIYTRGYALYASRWIITYATLGLLLLPLALYWANLGRTLYGLRLWPLLGAFLILCGVVGIEYYGTSGIDPQYYNRVVTIEEGLEMLAVSLGSLFVFEQFWPVHRRLRSLLASSWQKLKLIA